MLYLWVSFVNLNLNSTTGNVDKTFLEFEFVYLFIYFAINKLQKKVKNKHIKFKLQQVHICEFTTRKSILLNCIN